jgi:hypothetical protein
MHSYIEQELLKVAMMGDDIACWAVLQEPGVGETVGEALTSACNSAVGDIWDRDAKFSST